MPLPLLFIGIAAVTGATGVGKAAKAGIDVHTAMKLNKTANQIVTDATEVINNQRHACSDALKCLGEEKLFVLSGSMAQFLNTFSKLKNVDFRDSEGLDELSEIHIDEKEFRELKDLCTFAVSVLEGGVLGTAGGALVALGAYGAAQVLACASTGTAIATLSGAAATNATLAFFGGGAIAAGGLGMAGGTLVLGGLVAGPALMVMGFVMGAAAAKGLEQAKTNQMEALQLAEQLRVASEQCVAIRRRTYMFYNLLARLDVYFLPLIYKMEDIANTEGLDYSQYTQESKKVIASCASIAVSIKSVLDSKLLTDDGLLSDESTIVVENTREFINKLVWIC